MKRLKRLKKNEGLELCLREGFVSPTASSLCEPGGSRSGNYACEKGFVLSTQTTSSVVDRLPRELRLREGLRTFDVASLAAANIGRVELCLREGFVSPTRYQPRRRADRSLPLCLREGFVSPTSGTSSPCLRKGFVLSTAPESPDRSVNSELRQRKGFVLSTSEPWVMKRGSEADRSRLGPRSSAASQRLHPRRCPRLRG